MNKKSFLTKTLCTLVLALSMSSNLDAQLSQSVNMSKPIPASDPSPPIERDGLPLKRAGIAITANLNPIIYGSVKIGRDKLFYDSDPDNACVYTTNDPNPHAKSRFSLYTGFGVYPLGIFGRTMYHSSKEVPITLRNLNAYELKLSVVPLFQCDFFVANDFFGFGGGVAYDEKHYDSTKPVRQELYGLTDASPTSTGVFSPYIMGSVNLQHILKRIFPKIKMNRTIDLDIQTGYIPKTRDLPQEFKDLDKKHFPISVGLGYRPDVYKPINYHKAR